MTELQHATPENFDHATPALPGAHTLLTGFPGFLSFELLKRLATRQPEARFTLLVLPVMCAVADRMLHELCLEVPSLKGRCQLVEGDISRPRLGLDPARYAELTSSVTLVWHLAALYNLAVKEEVAYQVNLEGTRQVLRFCQACGDAFERLNYISTCYVSGDRTGSILERELVQGQAFKNHYESSKFWAEVEVQRHFSSLPITIFRPSIVVGDSRTGRIVKYDGPYYIFRLIDRLPAWFPLLNIGAGDAYVNLVPVDFVSEAMAHLGTTAGHDGQVFHLADPAPMKARDVLQLVSTAFDRKGAVGSLPAPMIERLLARSKTTRDMLDLPAEVLTYFNHLASYDTRNLEGALLPTTIRAPHLSTYLSVLLDFYRANPELGS